MTGLLEREFSRTSFLKGGGALLVTCALPGLQATTAGAALPGSSAEGVWPLAVHPNLDNWIAVHEDETVTISIAKADIGTHSVTGLVQIAAEELDMPFERMRIHEGDTMFTPDLGVSSGSSGITGGGPPVRAAAATARYELVKLASARLGVPTSQLTVQDGVVSVVGNPTSRVTYGQLIGGRLFNVTMTQNTQPYPYVPAYGNALPYGTAPLKPVSQYKIVGTSVPNHFIREKVTGTYTGIHNLKIPGMVHARLVRPPATGARVVGVDRSSVRKVQGLIDVVVKKDFVAVVTKTEWAAIQAAHQLKITWSKWEGGASRGMPRTNEIYPFMRTAPYRDRVARNVGDVDQALSGAAKLVTATYRSPYTTHGPIGPPAAIADVRKDQAIVYSATQSIFGMRAVTAKLLGLPEQNVRYVFYGGSSAYGASLAEDCAYDAALLSQLVGRPVRVQYMRGDDLIWGGGRAARVTDLRAGLDAQGNVVAFDQEVWSAANGGRPYGDLYATHGVVHEPERITPSSTLPGILAISGILAGIQPPFDVEGYQIPGVPSTRFSFDTGTATSRAVHHYLGIGSARTEPLDGQPQAAPVGSQRIRTSSMASPSGMPSQFVYESFIDELAAAAGADPVAYRIKYLTDPRNAAMVKAAAERARWETRPSPGPQARSSSAVVRGRGIALGKFAEVFEVEVNRKTGKVTVLKVVAAVDAGLVINPDSIVQQIEGNAMFGISQALREERTSDGTKVTSGDWVTYPILRFIDVPKEVDVVFINPKTTEFPPRSAAENNGSAAPAIGNAIFDATGVRIRTIPFTPKRVLAALHAAGKAA
jgi:CO/xanthine dehydrogenase Mo-binding subunit